jgi:hypothetical protein
MEEQAELSRVGFPVRAKRGYDLTEDLRGIGLEHGTAVAAGQRAAATAGQNSQE